MKPTLIAGIVLCLLGALALAYGGFSFTHRERVFDVGPFHATAEKRDSIPVPPILGVVALVAGVALVITNRRSRT